MKLLKLRGGRKLLKNESGGAAIEAAVGLPILLTTIFGILEVGNIVFISSAVENAVMRASRFGVTGIDEEGTTRLDQVRSVIEEQTFGRVNMDTVEIETLVYQNFSNIGQPEPYTDENSSGDWDTGEPYVDVNGNGGWDDDMGSAGLGGGGDIVVYRVRYTAESLTGLTTWVNRTFNISATVAVRNEPY